MNQKPLHIDEASHAKITFSFAPAGFASLHGSATAIFETKIGQLSTQWEKPPTLNQRREFPMAEDEVALVQLIESWISALINDKFGECAITFAPVEYLSNT